MGSKSRRSHETQPLPWAVELGSRVRRQRKALRLTQRELADLSRCGSDFLYDLERGKPTIRLDKLVPVLDVLGLSLKVEPRAGTSTMGEAGLSPTPTAVKR